MAKSSKDLSCAAKRHLDNFMQLLTNSGYDEKFRAEILNLGLKGFDKIVKADGVRPMFRSKGWNETSRWRAKRRKKNHLYVSVTLSQELQILASL